MKQIQAITPLVLHFFGGKPWNQAPSEYGDLQSWWSLAYHLLNKSEICLNDNLDNKKILSKFFQSEYLNQLPIIKSDQQTHNLNGKQKVECFWCKEKRGRTRAQHYSFDPRNGRWCSKLVPKS